MNLLDVVILLPMILFALLGFRNGIVREVLTIAGVILAVFIAFQFMEDLAGMLVPYLDQSRDVIRLLSGLILFSATFILVLCIALLIQKFLEIIKLSLINRLLGFLFGGLKYGIAVSAILILLAGLNLPAEETRDESVTYPYIIRLAPAAFNMIAAVYPGSDDFINQIQKTFDNTEVFENLPIFN